VNSNEIIPRRELWQGVPGPGPPLGATARCAGSPPPPAAGQCSLSPAPAAGGRMCGDGRTAAGGAGFTGGAFVRIHRYSDFLSGCTHRLSSSAMRKGYSVSQRSAVRSGSGADPRGVSRGRRSARLARAHRSLGQPAGCRAVRKSPSQFEKFAEDQAMACIRRGRQATLGPEPLLGYLAARETEIRSIVCCTPGCVRAGARRISGKG